MKKIFMLTVAAVLCLGLAMPAMAKVHVGGIVFLDAYYHRYDSEAAVNTAGLLAVPGTDDWQQLEIEVPGMTRLNANWVNDDGNVGMFIELGLGGANGASGVTMRHAYGWWQINPMFKLLVGHTDGSAFTLNPLQLLGMNAPINAPGVHVIGLMFGNLYDGRHPQIRLDTKFNDMITWRVAVLDNRATDADWPATSSEENVWPRIDTCLLMNFGPLYIEPGFSWAKAKQDEAGLGLGQDSSFVAWAAGLDAKFSMGPFSVAAEGVFGHNLERVSGWGIFIAPGTMSATGAVGPEIDSNLNMEDSENILFWIDAAFKVGPATIHAIYGLQDSDTFYTWFDTNAVRWREGEVESTRQMYGISVPITVAKVFIIRPEVFYYDWGDIDVPPASVPFTGIGDTPLGNEIIGGVQFQVVF
jgi:hypothetical protein